MFDTGLLDLEAVGEITAVHAVAHGPSAPFHLHPTDGADYALTGEIDALSIPVLDRLLTVLNPGASTNELVIDASALGFVNHTALLRLERHAEQAALNELVIHTTQPSVGRLSGMLNLRRVRVVVVTQPACPSTVLPRMPATSTTCSSTTPMRSCSGSSCSTCTTGSKPTNRSSSNSLRVPHPGLGAPWHPWSRYEAAINDLFADLPMWCVCLYDRRLTPDHVLADLERTHPHIRNGDGTQLPNVHYEDSRTFLQSMPPAPPDPREATPPAAELIDPSPAQARRSAEQAHNAGLTDDEIDDTKIAVSEAVTNALNYGTPPTTMKLWTDTGRLVVTVTDHGQGPPDPYAGLIHTAHPDGGLGGYGLWITHQLATATHSRTDNTFTIRLVTGKPLA